jgi:hypothetical protein
MKLNLFKPISSKRISTQTGPTRLSVFIFKELERLNLQAFPTPQPHDRFIIVGAHFSDFGSPVNRFLALDSKTS